MWDLSSHEGIETCSPPALESALTTGRQEVPIMNFLKRGLGHVLAIRPQDKILTPGPMQLPTTLKIISHRTTMM